MSIGPLSLPRTRLHWSVFPVAALLAYELAVGLLPGEAPGYSRGTYWLLALLVTAAFFLALLAHEVAHALVARRHGQRVHGITLWFLGGVAELEDDATRPGAELTMAAAGPLTSFAVAALLGALAWVLAAVGTGRLLVVAVAWLATVNGIIAVFNLLPAFPLDGGRILRAVLWKVTGNRSKATTWASQAGRAIGAGLIAFGIIGWLEGLAFNGLWLAVIGFFLVTSAGQQIAAERARTAYGDLRAGDFMTPAVTAPAHVSAGVLVEQWMRPNRLTFCPLVDPDGRVVGVVSLAAIRGVPPVEWFGTSARRLATPMASALTCQREEPAGELVDRLQASPVGGLLVFDGPRLAGLLTPADLAYAAQWRHDGRSGRGPARTAASTFPFR